MKKYSPRDIVKIYRSGVFGKELKEDSWHSYLITVDAFDGNIACVSINKLMFLIFLVMSYIVGDK